MGKVMIRDDIVVDRYLSDQFLQELLVLEVIFEVLIILQDHSCKRS